MLDFAKCEQLVSSSRDKRSKPVANNTRVEQRDENTYALRLHATDIATYHRDGRITVNSGGWRTVTTQARLHEFVTRETYSEQGIWYVRCERDESDPEPPRGNRTVLKPFHALDPGPEPVKSAEGCVAGEDETVTRTRSYAPDEPYQVTVRYGEARWNYERIEGIEYEQCPHCKLFDAQHDAWLSAANGDHWGRNKSHGYRAMVDALERYGSREAWQEAYIADFRDAREQRKVHHEWVDRNRVTFEDGMELTANGYAKRPNPKAIAREQRKVRAIEKKKERIDKFVRYAIEQLKAGIPMPSGGDCWYCAMTSAPQEEPRSGQISMGDAMPTLHSNGTVTLQANHEHLIDHIRERYVVPSMFVNALRERGYQDVGIYMHLNMDPDNDRMGGTERYGNYDGVARDLRRYLLKRLVPEAAR